MALWPSLQASDQWSFEGGDIHLSILTFHIMVHSQIGIEHFLVVLNFLTVCLVHISNISQRPRYQNIYEGGGGSSQICTKGPSRVKNGKITFECNFRCFVTFLHYTLWKIKGAAKFFCEHVKENILFSVWCHTLNISFLLIFGNIQSYK